MRRKIAVPRGWKRRAKSAITCSVRRRTCRFLGVKNRWSRDSPPLSALRKGDAAPALYQEVGHTVAKTRLVVALLFFF